MKARHVLVFAGLVPALTLAFVLATAQPAAAHHCQDFSDCFATADAASDALLGLTFLGMLSMALDFIPYVGTAKGVVEAATGRDILTGQELTATERLLGLIPGRIGRAGDLRSGARLGPPRPPRRAPPPPTRVPDAPGPPPSRPPSPPPSPEVPPAGLHVTTPRGTTYNIPEGWIGRPADNGKGIVFQRPQATGNADMIRIMEPTPQYPNGYARYYNSQGQPVDVNGKPGSKADTHIPEDYRGRITGWPST